MIGKLDRCQLHADNSMWFFSFSLFSSNECFSTHSDDSLNIGSQIYCIYLSFCSAFDIFHNLITISILLKENYDIIYLFYSLIKSKPSKINVDCYRCDCMCVIYFIHSFILSFIEEHQNRRTREREHFSCDKINNDSALIFATIIDEIKVRHRGRYCANNQRSSYHGSASAAAAVARALCAHTYIKCSPDIPFIFHLPIIDVFVPHLSLPLSPSHSILIYQPINCDPQNNSDLTFAQNDDELIIE